jgi:iron(III) transport system substrate-binding protein
MMRTVLASRTAENPQVAEGFIRHLLTLQAAGNPTNFPLPSLSLSEANDGQTTIALNPALMTYLDQMKRDDFIREWEDAIVQGE